MATTKLASSLWGGRTQLLSEPNSRVSRRTVRNAVVRANASQSKDALAAAVVSASLLNSAGAANAAVESTVDTAVNSLIDIVKATGDAVKIGLDAATSGAEYAKGAYEQVAPVVKTAVDAAAPVVQAGVKAAGDIAQPALKAAEPSLQAGLSGAQKALTSSLDASALTSTAKSVEQAAASAKPALEQFVTFVTTTEPVVLGEYALGLVAAYYLTPPLLKAGFGALRGYAGEVSPAAALDALSSQGNCVLIDIRSAKEKEAAGVPDLPNNGKLVELEFATVGDRKLRGQLRNAADLELKVTAMQIAALKKLNKGMTLYIMDRNGSSAKAVAKELNKRGFGRAFVMAGGFQSWANSKLKTKLTSTVSAVEVLAPGSFFGTGSSRRSSSAKSIPASVQSQRKALPSSIGR